MDIGQNIKTIREAKRIKQIEVATILGVDNSYYARLEKRGNKLSIEQLEKIADALGVSVKVLLFGETEDSKEDTQVLKTRIAELESIIKDKSKIISNLEDKVESTNETLADYWEYFIMEIADKYDFKVFVHVSDKEKKKLTIKEYLKLPTEIRKKVYLSNEEIEFSKEEKEKMYLELVQSEQYTRAVMLINDLEFNNEELVKAIRRYGKYDFMAVSTSIGDFTK